MIGPGCRNFQVSEFEIACEQTPAPVPEWANVAERIEAILNEANIYPPPATILQLESLVESESLKLAGEHVRHTIRSLERTPAARALERVILGDNGRSLADDATEVGCTKQNLHKHVLAIRRKLAPVDG